MTRYSGHIRDVKFNTNGQFIESSKGKIQQYHENSIDNVPWNNCDIIVDCTGVQSYNKFKESAE